jgi:hypothetical protein
MSSAFENFPAGHVHDLIAGLSGSTNRFVLTTRFITRGLRFVRDQPSLEVIHLTPLTIDELRETIGPRMMDDDVLAAVHALTDGHAGYAQALAEEMHSIGADPISALAALLSADAPLTRELTYSYELRLHAPCGYGALGHSRHPGQQEPLTERSRSAGRTPGRPRTTCPGSRRGLRSARARSHTIRPVARLWVRLHMAGRRRTMWSRGCTCAQRGRAGSAPHWWACAPQRPQAVGIIEID